MSKDDLIDSLQYSISMLYRRKSEDYGRRRWGAVWDREFKTTPDEGEVIDVEYRDVTLPALPAKAEP